METYTFSHVPTQIKSLKFEEKIPGKVGECIFDTWKCKSFQSPKVDHSASE